MQRPFIAWKFSAFLPVLVALPVFAGNGEPCWIHEQQIVHSPDGTVNHRFGHSLVAEGGRAVVTAPSAAPSQGRGVYVLEVDQDGIWQVTATLMPDLSPAFGGIGVSVDLDGDRLVIGSFSQFGNARVYLYTLDNGTWTLTQTIEPPPSIALHSFGHGVQLDGDRLVVGAMAPPDDPLVTLGSVSVLRADANGLFQFDQLIQLDDAEAGDGFGIWIALSGSVLVSGLPSRSIPGSVDAGVVVVFEDTGTEFVRRATIESPEPWSYGRFGNAVVLDAGRLGVLAPREVNNGIPGSGAAWDGRAWLFEMNSIDDWTPIASFDPPDAGALTGFGERIALNGNLLLVSSPWNLWNANPDTPVQGVVHSFIEHEKGEWERGELLMAMEPAPPASGSSFDAFGMGVGIAQGQVLVSTPAANANRGALYVFEHPIECEDTGPGCGGDPIIVPGCGPGPKNCPADLDCSGVVDANDLSILLAGFGGGCQGDINADGIVDADDLGILLARFGERCPPGE